MRIDWLRIRNFRGFEEREFRFAPHFNVMIGDNATGKTAVLESLAVAAGTWMLGVKGAASPQIRYEDVRVVGALIDEQMTYEEQYPAEIAAVGEVSGERVSWQRTRLGPRGNTTWKDAGQVRALAAQADTDVRKRNGAADPLLPVLAYYGAGRLWLQPKHSRGRTTLRQRELSRLEVYREGIQSRVSPRELTRWIEQQDYIGYQQRREPTLYRVAKAAMARLLEGADEIRFDPRRTEVTVRFRDGRLLPFSRLSDGQRSMLALTGDLAMRMARLNPQLGERVLDDTPGIVLIDELDLHLHPTWQQHVVEDLRRAFPRVQFIATTHSPFIVQTLRDSELISLDQQTIPEVANLGVETIAHDLMGVDPTDASPRYHEMVRAARSYFRTLDEAAAAPPEELDGYRDELARTIEPYADNPAYQAFLEMNRTARLRE